LNLRGLTGKSDTIYTNTAYRYSDKWTEVDVNVGIYLGNRRGNFQLRRFTTSENIAKSSRGRTILFGSHCKRFSPHL